MAWKVERSEDIERDLAARFDVFVGAALSFGADLDGAAAQATKRLRAVTAAIDGLARAPHQGTRRPDLGLGLRDVTRDRAIICFDLDQEARVVRVLAVVFGGQDHGARMRRRLDLAGGG